MRRGRIGPVLTGLLGLLVACRAPDPEPGSTADEGVEPVATSRGPATGEAFLEALLPVPGDSLVVVYDVKGEAGLGGSLELMVAKGGLRRENWDLRVTTGPEKVTNLRGTTVQTPEQIWTSVDDDVGAVTPVFLGSLARAYAESEPSRRKAAFTAIHGWRQALALARQEHPGETRTIAGETCLWQRVAAQTLCIWEEAGVPLRYEGPAMTLEAIRIDREPSLAADAFEVPPGAREVPAGEPLPEASGILDALAKGDASSLALVLQPGFRPPAPLKRAGSSG